MRRLLGGAVLAACLAISSVPVVVAEEAPAGPDEGAQSEPHGGRGRRGRLSDEQLQQLRERFEQRRNKTGGADGAVGLDPKRANLALVAEAFKAGQAAFKAENYPGAFEYLVDVAACAHIQGAANFADQSRAMILEMEKMAADKYEEARLKKLQGDGLGALEVLKALREKFYFTKVAEDANNLLVSLAGDPRVAAAVDMIAAEELDSAGKYPEAAERYSGIMQKYPDSVQALKAKLRLEAMQKDEATAAALKEGAGKAADANCPGWLAMARNFVANGREDRARPLFQKVVDSYPDSEYAKEARQALEELDAAAKRKASEEPAGQ